MSRDKTGSIDDLSFSEKKVPGLLSWSANGPAFVSLQSISDKADEIIAKHEKALENLPPNIQAGLSEQIKVQLEHLKDKNMPDCEIITNPVFSGFISVCSFQNLENFY